jgi:hypothetical protein
VKIEPAMMPGKANGKITVQNVWRGLAPRSAEASM